MGQQCGCCYGSHSLHGKYFLACEGSGEQSDFADLEDNFGEVTSPKNGTRGARRGGNARIGNMKSTIIRQKGEEHLMLHKRDRGKGKETKQLIRSAVKQDRVCALLEEAEIENILETMEYFEFDIGDIVVRQGDVGTTFFVTHTGLMEVSVNNRVVNTVKRGASFGGISLLYKCARTASVMAKTACGVWGAQGDAFHKILQDHAKKGYNENRRFLNSIKLFDVFADKQKDRIGEACFIEVFNAGARVLTEGELASAIYFVKQGTLTMYENAVINNRGTVEEGIEVGEIEEQECFGEESLLHNQPHPYTLVAQNRCELLCISGDQLREILGNDLRGCLEQNFVLSYLKRSPVMGQFSSTQQYAIVNAMAFTDYKYGESIPTELGFAVVLGGEVTGENMETPVTLQRGSWFEQDTLIECVEMGVRSRNSSEGFSSCRKSGISISGKSEDDRPFPSERSDRTARSHTGSFIRKSIRSNHTEVSESSGFSIGHSKTEKAFGRLEAGRKGLRDLSAGRLGARLAILSEEELAKVLKRLGLAQVGTAEEAEDYGRKMMLVRRARIFKHLPQEAKDRLVRSILLQTFSEGDYVMKQGEIGDKFFLLQGGEIEMYVDGVLLKTMHKNQFFGERALLYDEPRSMTAKVSSEEAHVWYITKNDFGLVVKAKMQEEMINRICLHEASVKLKDLKHVKLVGSGAAGSVRLVQHKTSKTRYALKRVNKRQGKVPEEVKRECDLLAEQDHPFIMHLVRTFETEKSVYLLTELITGGELHAAIRSIPTVLTRIQTQFYGGSLVLTLEYLSERNIIFRDLKPENVMLDRHGYLKLIDFGISKKLSEGKTRTFTMIGTPHYMAPETMKGKGYGTEVDIWALGVIMFEFVVGYLPFADELEDATEICAAVSQDPLVFPPEYRDEDGKSLISGLLVRQQKKRLGSGLNGYEEIKTHDFFTDGYETALVFTKILSRELDAPIQPKGETYCPEEEMASVTLSDAEELA